MVKRFRRCFMLLALLALALTCGCSGGALRDACDATNSLIGVAGAYVDEAQFAVDRARQVAAAMPEAIRPEAINSVNIAEATLFAATQLATTASEQCASFNLVDMFKDFAVAWDDVKRILDKTGGSALGVIDPKAYGLGKKAQ